MKMFLLLAVTTCLVFSGIEAYVKEINHLDMYGQGYVESKVQEVLSNEK